jgi:hypothetical protein
MQNRFTDTKVRVLLGCSVLVIVAFVGIQAAQAQSAEGETPVGSINIQPQSQEISVGAPQAAIPSSPLAVDVWEDLPRTEANRPEAVAVVIGIDDYANDQVPDVQFARRDAALMRRYLTDVLGYREDNILPADPDRPMTLGAMQSLFRQRLPNYLRNGVDVFVYYSGHGAPSLGDNPQAYLVPSDADPNAVTDNNAYRLSQLYEDLTQVAREHDAASLTVVVDACFSGQGRNGDLLIRQASPLVLTVESPILTMENAAVFTASGQKEVANWYPEKGHGMFTYFFLKGLRGEADINGDNQITVGEMHRYISDPDHGVPYWSGREHGRPQHPQTQTADPSQVLVRFNQ